jgi:hypothetical protein
MNSSQIVKRTIPVLIVILLIVGAAVLASVLNRDKLVPTITDEDGVYLTINDKNRSYNITKKFMYDELKQNVGLRTLLDMIDRRLLETTAKGDSNYYASITEEQIDEAIDKAVFASGKEGLTEEEIQEKYDEYYRSMFISSGLKTNEDKAKDEVRAYHRLTLAKKAYASDELAKEIERVNKLAEEDDSMDPYFTDSEYQSKYKAKYLPAYWAIIIPFQTETEAKLALEQVGLKADLDSKSGSFSNLVKIDNEEEVASATEVAKAFIEMYNTFNASFIKEYPNSRLTLKEGVQYRYNEEGQIVFNNVLDDNEEMNTLYYTNEAVAKVNKQIENFMKSMDSYAPTSTENKWYTAEPRLYDSKMYVYILKIKAELVPEFETVKDEIFKVLFDEELTENYISKRMFELREANNIEIFDAALESEYKEIVEGLDFDFKKTKVESENLVARIKDKDFSADELFAEMDKHYGMSLVTSEIDYLRFLNSEDLNKIYDYYTEGLTSGQRVLNKEKWEEVRTATINEKNIFLGGGYSSYPPTYGWKNFLRDYHGVNNVEELMYSLLYKKLRSEYASTFLKVEDLTEESDKWKEILGYMQKTVDEYFTVNGLQVFISVKDKDGKYLPVEEWSDLQKQYAEELYADIWEYIKDESGYDTALNALVQKFKDAPRFLASLDQELSVQPALEGNPYVIADGSYNIEVSKYKSAGLSIEYLKINTLSHTTAVTDTTTEALKEAAKEIFDTKPTGEVRYGYTYGSDEYEYLIGKTGYHIYINTSIVEASTWNYTNDTETKYVLPTLQMVKTIAKDNALDKLIDEDGNITDIEFTAAMRTAVTKYFDPVKNEITGGINLAINLYSQMQEMNLDFKVDNYSKEEFNLYLTKVIELYKDNLTYIEVEE